MYNLLPHSKPSAWFYFDDKCSDTKIKESVACKQNKTPLYTQLHTPGYVQRFKREQMPSLISFRGFFNLEVWFLWLLINPYPVYLQAKDFSNQGAVSRNQLHDSHIFVGDLQRCHEVDKPFHKAMTDMISIYRDTSSSRS